MTWPEWITWDRVLAWIVGVVGFISFVAREHIKQWMAHRWARKRKQEEEERVTDKALFARFLKELPYNDSIRFIDEHHMGTAFQQEQRLLLKDFLYHWEGPESQFLDEEVEAKRKALYVLLSEHGRYLANNTFQCDITSGTYYSVPREWRETQPERFEEVVTALHAMAHDIVQAYREFVELGKSRLKC